MSPPFYDDTAATFSNAAIGLDTHSLQADNTSIFDSAANVVTKGVPLTAFSIINSFANTGIKIANLFGADVAPIDPEEQAKNYLGQDAADYYAAHSGLVELGGLAIGSFIPGLAALRALKAIQATGETGALMGRALGFFSGARQKIIANAVSQMELGEGALFPTISGADKYKAIAAGFGDQAVQSLVWETASLATQNASPLLTDLDLKDTLWNVGVGTLFGGAVGGVIEGFGVKKAFETVRNKAILDTNIYEAFTRYGGMDAMVGGGDRTAAIVAALEAIPAATAELPASRLGSTRFNAARQNAILDAKKFLQTVGSKDDPDLTNSLVDSLISFREKGLATGEDTYNLLMRLGKASRLTLDAEENSLGTIPTGEHFYINRFASRADATFENMISIGSGIHNLPDDPSKVTSSLYRMIRPGDRPNIARFTDELTMPDGSTIPRYKNAGEAFADGADIFVDRKFNIAVNTSSDRLEQIARRGEELSLNRRAETIFGRTGSVPPGTREPTGASVIYHTDTGELSTAALPVVGDIASPANVRVIKEGLLVGDHLVPQTIAKPLSSATPSFEANARYVWAGKRGIQAGDAIDSSDIPFLEQLYREANAFSGAGKGTISDYATMMERRGVTIFDAGTGEGISIPRSQDTFEQLILDRKNSLIAELMTHGEEGAQNAGKLSAEEIAQRANVPESYISSGLRSPTFAGATIPLEKNLAVNHVKLEYNLNRFYRDDEGMIARGNVDLQYRIKVIQDAADTALVNFARDSFEQLKVRGVTSQQVGPEGAGAGFFSAANAAYGSVAQKFERVGRAAADLILNRNKANIDHIFAPAQALREDALATQEAQNFKFIRQTTSQTYEFLPAELAQRYKVSPDTAVLSSSLVKDRSGAILDWNRNFTPDGFLPAAALGDQAGQFEYSALHTFYSLSPKVAAFERANLELNDTRVVQRNNWWVAMGMQPKLKAGILYTPPIDTAKYPYFAMVRQLQGQGLGESSVSIIVAKDAKGLQQKIAAIDDGAYEVMTKADIKKYHEVKGDYDYDRNFAQNTVNSDLRRRGILNDLVPDVGAESLIRDIVDWHAKQETRLVRDYIELGNAQLFAEIKSMGERYTSTETSKSGFVPAIFGRTAQNPYNDLIKTALAISPKENYRLWADANEKLEAYFSSAFEAAKNGFGLAKQGILPYEEANNLTQKMGLGKIYETAMMTGNAYTEIAQKLPPQRYLSQFVSTANSVMAATAIRLDFFQSLINVISTPVLMLAEAHSARSAVQEMLTTALPGTGQRVPSATKLMFQAISSFVSRDATHADLTPILLRSGALKSDNADYYRLLDTMTLPLGKLSDSAWTEKLKTMVELGSKYTGNNIAEEVSRYVPGYMAYKIFSAAGHSGQALEDNIATFVNRVQGNYTAAQRPVAFQGPLGQAIGLFQTYQVNLLQQMLRYVQNGEAKSLAILAGVQTSLFGINGLPGFQAINQHLVGLAAGNPSHSDAYSSLTSPGIHSLNPLQKDVGDYLLYGTLSNVLSTGLYSRGDINPRNITVLPINPLDFPAVSGGIKLLSSLMQVGKAIANGGDVPTSLLLGLEHNGLSRPLSGLAQLSQGYVTTGQGGIVATTRPGLGDNTAGFSELVSIANFSRLLGARPLDEAVVLDATYRRTLYQAADRTRIESLGEAFKTNIYGSEPDAALVNSFTAKYTAAGGNIVNYGKTILSWTSNANASVANRIYQQMQTPANQNMIRAMGGLKLPDYRTYNTGVPASADAAATVE